MQIYLINRFLDFNLLLLFAISSVTLTLFPGPDIFFVFSTSLARGWKKGVLASLGLTSGLWVHTFLVILGVGKLLKQYPESQRILEFLGGFYLLFLAYNLIKKKSAKVNELKNISNKIKKYRFYLTGLIMNLTNPKVTLFFLSFFPGFLFHQSWPYSRQFLILGTIFFIQALFIFTTVSIFAGHLRKNINFKKEDSLWNKFQAIVLALIALVLFYP